MRRRASALAPLLAVAVVLAGCSSKKGGDGGGSAEPTAGATAGASGSLTPTADRRTTATGSSASATATASGTSAAPSSGSSSVPNGGASSTAPGGGSSTASSTPPPPAPAGTPAYGTYPVRVDGYESLGGSRRDYPPSSTIEVRQGSGSDQRMLHIAWSGDRSDDVTVSIAGRAVRLQKAVTHIKVGLFSIDQPFTPKPPVLLLPAGAHVGQRWSGKADDAAGVHVVYSGQVVRSESVTVGGQRVACLVVTVKQTFSGQYAGTVTTTTHWYVDRLTPVRQRTDSNLHSDQGNYEQHASVTLQRLTPR